jgi:3-isopropylmalate/(R)-2-methylmalate dehydratase small subunit
MKFTGTCWTFGHNIPTDQLVKSRYVFEPMTEIVKHVLEDLNPDFPARVRPGDIVVAGRHFGQSSGRAIATKALKATGIAAVIAETFARTFYRNCFEIGLPILEVPEVTALVTDGDQVTVDIGAGAFHNVTTGAVRTVSPPDTFLLDMLSAGGLITMASRRPELFSMTHIGEERADA